MNDVKINIVSKKNLSNSYYNLSLYELEYQDDVTAKQLQKREVFDRGNGAAVLLYNLDKQTVILISQFRLPTYLNGNKSGILIEVCAGSLEEDNPDECIKREILEETGFEINKVTRVFETYMSPGAVTEILYLYVAEYTDEMKVSQGGGLVSESENIKIHEFSFSDTINMVKDGTIKDAKTIMLLQYAQLYIFK